MLEKAIEDNKMTIVVSEVDIEYYQQKGKEIDKMKNKKKDDREVKKLLVQENKDNIERVEKKIETLKKWVKVAENRLKKEE